MTGRVIHLVLEVAILAAFIACLRLQSSGLTPIASVLLAIAFAIVTLSHIDLVLRGARP